MKRVFSLLLLLVAFAVIAVAGCKPAQKDDKSVPAATSVSPETGPAKTSKASSGPEIIVLKASSGDVKFYHHKHQQRGVVCSVCHGDSVGKIAKMDMKWGHDTCKGCHTSKGAGPRACNECHKK